MALCLLLLLSVGVKADNGDLSIYTTSTDTTKQCTVGDSSKTKTGESELTMKMVYILQNNFDPTDGTLIVDLPSRYYDYYIGNGDDTTTDGSNSLIDFGSHESMVDSSIYTLYMKWTDSGTGTTY